MFFFFFSLCNWTEQIFLGIHWTKQQSTAYMEKKSLSGCYSQKSKCCHHSGKVYDKKTNKKRKYFGLLIRWLTKLAFRYMFSVFWLWCAHLCALTCLYKWACVCVSACEPCWGAVGNCVVVGPSVIVVWHFAFLFFFFFLLPFILLQESWTNNLKVPLQFNLYLL